MMERPDFPLVWDNTMRATFVACPRKCFWEYFSHLKPLSQSIDLHAGKAWAAALEAARRAFYIEGLSSVEAEARALLKLIETYGDFDCPEDNPKTLERMTGALVYYFSAFPLETDPAQPYIGHNGPMIEFSFALPLDPELVHPVTDEPIIYTGRADMMATFAGAMTVYDDKTTKALGKTWGQQWDLRSQFSGYAWAANQFDIHCTQVLVRGICIQKTQYNHAQAIPTRPAYAVERWHAQCVRDIRRAIDCWKEGYFDYNLSDACSSYGGCMFRQPCMSSDANQKDWLMGGNFAIRKWNPLTREEEIVS